MGSGAGHPLVFQITGINVRISDHFHTPRFHQRSHGVWPRIEMEEEGVSMRYLAIQGWLRLFHWAVGFSEL